MYLKLALMLIVPIVLQQTAIAQSTIFNIPTTDTVSPKKAYFEFDYLPQIPKINLVYADQSPGRRG